MKSRRRSRILRREESATKHSPANIAAIVRLQGPVAHVRSAIHDAVPRDPARRGRLDLGARVRGARCGQREARRRARRRRADRGSRAAGAAGGRARAGEGLYASVVLLPPPRLSAAGADDGRGTRGARRGRARWASCEARSKWPNDVVVRTARRREARRRPGRDARARSRAAALRRRHRPQRRAARVPAASSRDERAVTSLRLLGCDVDDRGALEAVLDALARRARAIRADPRGSRATTCGHAGSRGGACACRPATAQFEGRVGPRLEGGLVPRRGGRRRRDSRSRSCARSTCADSSVVRRRLHSATSRALGPTACPDPTAEAPAICARSASSAASRTARRAPCWRASATRGSSCTAMATDGVPPFLQGAGRGWLTAEYSMLPSSTETRKSRDRVGIGRRALGRDPAADLALAARRDGPHADDRAHDLGRLRRDPGRRRHAHGRDQRRVRRAARSPDAHGRQARPARLAAREPARGRVGRRRRRRRAVRPLLRRGQQAPRPT